MSRAGAGSLPEVLFQNTGLKFSLLRIYELLPAFLCSCIAIVVVSLLTKEPEQAVLDEFDHYMDDITPERSLDAVLEGDIPLQ